MFPPPRIRAQAIPIYALTPSQLEALHDLHMLRKEAEAEVQRIVDFLEMVDALEPVDASRPGPANTATEDRP